MRLIRAAIAAALLAVAAPPVASAPPSLASGLDAGDAPSAPVQVVRSFPHDPNAFTQGLFFHHGRLFESTGQYGQSTLREVALDSGKVLRQVRIESQYFGEGSTDWGDDIVSLTWMNGVAFRWRLADFKRLGQLSYHTEGWGLTHDASALILSDGSSMLYFLDPATLGERRRIIVHDGRREVPQLNELEYVHGEILANVWMTDRIARIDPATGAVKGWIDCGAIVRKLHLRDPDAVLNGIAFDAESGRLFITGKDWPQLYEIKIAPSATR